MSRTLPLLGAIACILACLGLPLVAGALAAAGLTFLLSIDWILLPLAMALIALTILAARRGSPPR